MFVLLCESVKNSAITTRPTTTKKKGPKGLGRSTKREGNQVPINSKSSSAHRLEGGDYKRTEGLHGLVTDNLRLFRRRKRNPPQKKTHQGGARSPQVTAHSAARPPPPPRIYRGSAFERSEHSRQKLKYCNRGHTRNFPKRKICPHGYRLSKIAPRQPASQPAMANYATRSQPTSQQRPASSRLAMPLARTTPALKKEPLRRPTAPAAAPGAAATTSKLPRVAMLAHPSKPASAPAAATTRRTPVFFSSMVPQQQSKPQAQTRTAVAMMVHSYSLLSSEFRP